MFHTIRCLRSSSAITLIVPVGTASIIVVANKMEQLTKFRRAPVEFPTRFLDPSSCVFPIRRRTMTRGAQCFDQKGFGSRMLTQFSTRCVPPSDRAEAWSEAISSICGPFTTSYGTGTVDAEIDLHRFGGLTCARVKHNFPELNRTRRDVAHLDPGLVYLVLQMVGHCRIEQGSHDISLGPGELTLLQSGRPCRLLFQGGSLEIPLHIPLRLIEAGTRVRLPIGTVISGPLAGLIGAYISTIVSDKQVCNTNEIDAVERSLILLLGSVRIAEPALSAPIQKRPNGTELRSSVKDYLEAQLCDPNLSPEKIARGLGMSVRNLHRLFAKSGTTVMSEVLRMRLARCANDLVRSERDAPSITEICFRWGFNDSANFSRAFKCAFGIPPREYRLGWLTQPQ